MTKKLILDDGLFKNLDTRLIVYNTYTVYGVNCLNKF